LLKNVETFVQIFDKSKLLGMRFHPQPLHHWCLTSCSWLLTMIYEATQTFAPAGWQHKMYMYVLMRITGFNHAAIHLAMNETLKAQDKQ